MAWKKNIYIVYYFFPGGLVSFNGRSNFRNKHYINIKKVRKVSQKIMVLKNLENLYQAKKTQGSKLKRFKVQKGSKINILESFTKYL